MAATDRISLTEAAEQLGVHYMTAYRYVRTGRLPAERDGVLWTVDPADLTRVGESRSARAAGRPRRSGDGGRIRAGAPGRLAARLVAGDEGGAWAVVESVLDGGVDPAEV